jgi:hypothetical protein
VKEGKYIYIYIYIYIYMGPPLTEGIKESIPSWLDLIEEKNVSLDFHHGRLGATRASSLNAMTLSKKNY